MLFYALNIFNISAAHSCGHNAQIAAMVGASMGLILFKTNDYLDGDIELIVPAKTLVMTAIDLLFDVVKKGLKVKILNPN